MAKQNKRLGQYILTFFLMTLSSCASFPPQEYVAAKGGRLVTSNIYQRTFFIKFGEITGTAFAIDVDGRQYLITASHIVAGLDSDGQIEIRNDEKWFLLDVALVGRAPSPIDITVLALKQQIAPKLPLSIDGSLTKYLASSTASCMRQDALSRTCAKHCS